MSSSSQVTVSDSVQLEILYDLFKKEFAIRFETQEQARAYQSKNPEGRIFTDKDKREVWLPRTSSMKHLRASGLGLAIVFETEESAKAWRERSVLAKEYPPEKERAAVYIQRDWRRTEFESLVGGGKATEMGLRPPSYRKPNSRPASRQGDHNVLPKEVPNPSPKPSSYQVKESPGSILKIPK